MAKNPTIIDACLHPDLFGPWFKDPTTWVAWFAFLKALFALPMSPYELGIYRQCTGRTKPPEVAATEAWLVCGRRSGKSFIAALLAVFVACFKDWTSFLAPGERATVLVIAADRKQARVVMRYVMGLLNGIPSLKQLIEGETKESVSLFGRVDIEVHSASFQRVRGYTVVCAICDEIAFWQGAVEDSAQPDTEIVNAIRPAMATVPGAMLLGLSSPYARRGVLFDQWTAHYRRDGDPVLVWQAETRRMNPSVPQSFIDAAYEADAANAAAEYGAQFRTDVASFLDDRSVAEACRDQVGDLPFREGLGYTAFVDPSGGRHDAMTLAIAHAEEGKRIIDATRVRTPPFSPQTTVEEFVGTLTRYRIKEVVGDRYGAAWVQEAFTKAGVIYTTSTMAKSDLYREMATMFAAQEVEIPPQKRLITELCNLERRVGRSGRDIIDHPPRGHDDLANAVAGALVHVRQPGSGVAVFHVSGSGDDLPPGAEPFRSLSDLSRGWTDW